METNPIPSPSRLPFLFFGLVVGLLIAGVVWFFVGKEDKPNQTANNESKVLSLKIETPEENLATSRDSITLRGNTQVSGVVTVTSSTETKILQSNDTTFSTSIKLAEGKNVISITAYDPATGNSQTQVREVLYIDEDLGSL